MGVISRGLKRRQPVMWHSGEEHEHGLDICVLSLSAQRWEGHMDENDQDCLGPKWSGMSETTGV